MTTKNAEMNAHFQSVIDAYRSFLECDGESFHVATLNDGSVVIEPDDSDRTFTFTIGNLCVHVAITNGEAKATQQYNMHGVTQPTLHHIREHLNQMSECEAGGIRCRCGYTVNGHCSRCENADGRRVGTVTVHLSEGDAMWRLLSDVMVEVGFPLSVTFVVLAFVAFLFSGCMGAHQ